MRVIAAIYVGIVLANLSMWIAGRGDQAVFPTPYYYLIWALYFLGVLALTGFVLRRRLLPRRFWQLVFVVYLSTRMGELVMAGPVLTAASFAENMNIIATYLWMAVPAGMAIWYLGFVRAGLFEYRRQSRASRWMLPG